ncbi:MAG: arabinofuranosyltransferase [Candidatus Parcubacteria bacterium]|nr:arabinofuranosyltransferase [Candidatus Parcubacteria bacterium]
MNELSLTTIHIIALAKIVLFIYFGVTIFLIWKNKKPHWHLIAFTSAIFIFYLTLSYPLKRLWWSNNGDELFTGAFLTRVLNGQIFSDFYYTNLAPFYPPLYFWVTGTISRLVTSNAITAAKIGILGTILIWFIGSYFWQKLFWNKLDQARDKIAIYKSPRFWLLFPIIYFISLDFDNIIVKPYETIPALFSVILIGIIADSFSWEKWNWKNYCFLGVSAGLLFLTYYFWWFILIPAMFFLALTSRTKILNIKRIILLGFAIFAISSIYIIPLFLNYSHFGMENWQAVFFVPTDFITFAPWQSLSLKSLIFLAGIIGLIAFAQEKFIKANLIVLATCFIYQFINLIIYTFNAKPLQCQKPFLFLGGATLCVGATYLVIYIWNNYLKTSETKKIAALCAIVIFLPLLPMIKFIDDPVIPEQIEKNLIVSDFKILAQIIEKDIPGYKTMNWLTSGTPEINLYIPLNYYIAHNPHFSHPAAIYSRRLDLIQKISSAKTPEEFNEILNESKPLITGLILIKDKENYPLSYWRDNYPNGGKELIINLPQNLISDQYWQKIYSDNLWDIYTKK